MLYQKPRAILFDWDNTLADTWPVIHLALTNTFHMMGQAPWTFEMTKERVHRSLRDSFPEIFGKEWEKAGEIYLKNFEAIHLQHLKALEGAEATLQLLKKTDIYVAVVSNKTGYNLREEIEHLGWNDYFQKAVGARDAAKDKPSPDPVYLALEGTYIAPSQAVWLIGDSITDLECAYNSNCLPVFYGNDDPTQPRFIHCRPAIHVKNHQLLLNIIETF